MNYLKKSTSSLKELSRNISSRRVKGTVQIPPAKRLLDLDEKWNEKRETQKSLFEYFQPNKAWFGPDTMRVLQTPIDISPSNIRKWYDRRHADEEEHMQAFIKKRYDILGPDLAAAHFIVHRGGAIRFYNEKEWVRAKENGEYTLPTNKVRGLFVEAIDCHGFLLRHTGLENILDLPKLRWLSFAGQDLVDDFTLDSVSGSYGETLQYLDISNCPRISHRGLSCFYRFQKLDTLVVNGTSNTDEFKLACMMLEDIKPKLTIKGIEYPTIPPKQ